MFYKLQKFKSYKIDANLRLGLLTVCLYEYEGKIHNINLRPTAEECIHKSNTSHKQPWVSETAG